jgi:glycerate kinase
VKIVIAPDSYKESLTALQVETEIEAGFREIFPDAVYVKLPMADGGEGTVAALVAATGGRLCEAEVTDPLGGKTVACFGLTGDGKTAIIETAAASGLALVAPLLRNPLRTTSYGTGELIKAALDAGVVTSSSVSAAAPLTMAAPGCFRRWGSGCWTAPEPISTVAGPIWRVSTGSMRAASTPG